MPAGGRWDLTRRLKGQDIQKGKYELGPAVKKLYQLLPEMSASCVSVASRVVNPKHDELRPALSKELHQLHRKTWVYNWKVLTQCYCTLLYTQLYAHIQNCWMISTAVPLQAWSGPEGSRKLRFPDFKTTAQDGSKVVSLTHRPPLPPGNVPGTHFC